MDTKIEKILRLVQEGKMSAEEADSLLGLLKMKDKNSRQGCNLRVRIIKDDGDGEKNVNLNLPMSFVKMMVKATGKFSIDSMGKNNSVKESLSNVGLKFDENGKIEDVESFLKGLDALCEHSPIDIANVQVSDGDGDVDIRISID
ncbi:MAG: hypothetical protein PHW02_01615 [bacterium]|nr:hypothetical protein [bacterium]